MKLPNKVTSYTESVLGRLPLILQTLSSKDGSVYDVYQATKHQYGHFEEYIDALDCLFALGKINVDEKGVLHYVA